MTYLCGGKFTLITLRMKKNLIHRYLSSTVLPIWAILLLDLLIIVISCLMAYALRYDFRSIFSETSSIDRTIIWLWQRIYFVSASSVPTRTYCASPHLSISCAFSFLSLLRLQRWLVWVLYQNNISAWGSPYQCTLHGLYHQFCHDVLFTCGG